MLTTLLATVFERAAIVLAAGDLKSRVIWALKDTIKRAGLQDVPFDSDKKSDLEVEIAVALNCIYAVLWEGGARVQETLQYGLKLGEANQTWEQIITKVSENLDEHVQFVAWGKYIPWIFAKVNARMDWRFVEKTLARAILTYTEAVKKKSEGLNPDINQYKTAESLVDAVNNAVSKRFEVVQEDESYKVIETFSQAALTGPRPSVPAWMLVDLFFYRGTSKVAIDAPTGNKADNALLMSNADKAFMKEMWKGMESQADGGYERLYQSVFSQDIVFLGDIGVLYVVRGIDLYARRLQAEIDGDIKENILRRIYKVWHKKKVKISEIEKLGGSSKKWVDSVRENLNRQQRSRFITIQFRTAFGVFEAVPNDITDPNEDFELTYTMYGEHRF